MNLAPADWAIVLVVLGIMVSGVLLTRTYMRSVADFLAAGRTAGRYLLVCDLDRLLHRGAYVIADETRIVEPAPARRMKLLGMGREFTRGDRLIYLLTYAWTFSWVIVFALGTFFSLRRGVSDATWIEFWEIYVYVQIVASVLIVTWFAVGGVRDIRVMFQLLDEMKRDHADDGFVVRELPLHGADA